MKQEMVGQSNQLKGGSHQPHQCSINGMEWVINPWSTVSNCGSFNARITRHNGWPLSARHKYLPEKVLVRSVKNE